MKIIIKNWADLENAKTEYEKSADKAAFIENCVFDTDVEFDKETGATKLSLDLQDILGNGYYTNFAWYVLENTMKNSFKNKKSKALFINTVMRKIGTDMVVDSRANVTLYGKQAYNTGDDVLWFVNGMLAGQGRKLLDSDAMVIYNIVNKLSSELVFNGVRFDADNPLHQKLARIVIPIEEQGYGRYKGFQKRWLRDTQPSHNLTKKEKNENDVMANISNMSIDELYKYYTNNKLDDAKKLMFLSEMINRAPVNQKWCLNLGRLLPSISSYSIKKEKAVWVDDAYKVIEHFARKYNDFINSAMMDLENKQDVSDKAKEYRDEKKKAYEDKKRDYDELQQKRQTWYKFYNGLGDALSNLQQEIYNIDRKNKKEKDFYQSVYDELGQCIQKFRESYDKSELKKVELGSKRPWGIFGPNKQQENRYEKLNQIVNEYNDLIKNIPDQYTNDDSVNEQKYRQKVQELNNSVDDADWRAKNAERELSKINDFLSAFGYVNKNIVESRQTRADIYNNAKRRLQEKRAKQPVVKSGYNQWSKDARNAEYNRKVVSQMKKMRSANPTLTEEDLRVLAERVLKAQTNG